MAAKTDPTRQVGTMVLVSLALHTVAAVALHAAGLFSSSIVPKPQQVMTARLVRLGPERDRKLLPTLAPAPRAPPAKKAAAPNAPAAVPKPAPPAANAAAVAPAAPTALTQDASGTPKAQAARTQSALQRLRELAAGAPDGDVAGDADDALAGDRYTAEVERCMRAQFVIEGTQPLLVANRQAQALVRIAASGRIIDFRITRSSGLQAFDSAVTRAVRACTQVSPPPTDRREQLRRAGIVVTFRP